MTKEAEQMFTNELNDLVDEQMKNIEKQKELFLTKVMIQDIITAYKGELTYNQYLKDRSMHNEKIRSSNKAFDLSQDSYSFIYTPELPILDFKAWMIAEIIGRNERGNK